MRDEYTVKLCSHDHDCWVSWKIFWFVGMNMDGILLINVKCRLRGSVRFNEE